MALQPTPIVVIADAVEDASLRISMNALRSGALAVVEKPGGLLSGGYEAAARIIATQLAIMSEVPVIRRRGGATGGSAGLPASDPGATGSAARATVMAVAASTGGPPALARLLGALPASFPLPVLLVQHIGAPFIEGFASWLDGLVPMRVALACDDEPLLPGRVLVAPGNRHLGIAGGIGGMRARLQAGPPVSGQRPSASVMFEQLAAFGSAGLGVLLTGMGEDGATGLAAMKRAGAYTITEHESSAVVYGMPAAAVRLGGSCASIPLDLIAPRILQMLQPRMSDPVARSRS
jgi:two-component system chemotaxis response regulator CheB